MAYLSLTLGSESWADHSAQMRAFVLMNGIEVPFYKALADLMHSVNSKQTLDARPGMRRELGRWTVGCYDVPDGLIIKVYGETHRGHGNPVLKGNIYLETRANAAMRTAQFPMSSIGALSGAYVRGRYDILTPDEAKRRGMPDNPFFRHLDDDVSVRRLWTQQEIEPEISARAVITRQRVRNMGRETVVIERQERRRSLDLDT